MGPGETARQDGEEEKEDPAKIVIVAMDLIQRQGFDSTTMEQYCGSDIARKTLITTFP